MDQLTGLGDRGDLLMRLQGPDTAVGGIFVDIDAFNGVSHAFGHVEGDRILVELGRWLSRRGKALGLDTFRTGGDDFVLIGDALTDDRAKEIASELVRDSQTLGFPYAHPLSTRTVFSLSAV